MSTKRELENTCNEEVSNEEVSNVEVSEAKRARTEEEEKTSVLHPVYLANKRQTKGLVGVVIDVTSRATDKYQRLSPFYPHASADGQPLLPIPGAEHLGWQSYSVEGIWQGLKCIVSENARAPSASMAAQYAGAPEGTDVSKFRNRSMTKLKRKGRPEGHVWMADNSRLGYVEARRKIYLPAYRHMLREHAQDLLADMREILRTQPITLLDYDTNADVENTKRPLAHASIIRAELMNLDM